MKEPVKVAHYIRRGRPERAVIYVRGDSKTEQEMFCYFYAYKTRYATLCGTSKKG